MEKRNRKNQLILRLSDDEKYILEPNVKMQNTRIKMIIFGI